MTSIQHLSDRMEAGLATMRGDQVRLGQPFDAHTQELQGLRQEIGTMRGDSAVRFTQVNAEFMALSDRLQSKAVEDMNGLKEVVRRAEAQFAEHTAKIATHEATLGSASEQFALFRAEVEAHLSLNTRHTLYCRSAAMEAVKHLCMSQHR